MNSEMFRANVGIAIVKGNQILLFERADIKDQWQLPQGGIDLGEKPAEAALRELQEETGLFESDVVLLGEYPEWLAYELPDNLKNGNYLGQVQKWFIFSLKTSEDSINLNGDNHPEFVRFQWIHVDNLESYAVSFRKSIYRQVASFIKSLN